MSLFTEVLEIVRNSVPAEHAESILVFALYIPGDTDPEARIHDYCNVLQTVTFETETMPFSIEFHEHRFRGDADVMEYVIIGFCIPSVVQFYQLSELTAVWNTVASQVAPNAWGLVGHPFLRTQTPPRWSEILTSAPNEQL